MFSGFCGLVSTCRRDAAGLSVWPLRPSGEMRSASKPLSLVRSRFSWRRNVRWAEAVGCTFRLESDAWITMFEFTGGRVKSRRPSRTGTVLSSSTCFSATGAASPRHRESD
ncbi:hypothetical protein STH3225 [Symbiobacterium thermophilum IAM 14863]|uniref:Uncharacterized protein n=1 Tax=Symbiobacterium thermophilum (strain DSM 24528 / JCM 14929 / IAM 14863 / T) TaxID=292459 RepID=Q67JE3_SYMTH|nr:hypothetical protein STH3225 [Symbiobacterium thermophilum IAM 14863]